MKSVNDFADQQPKSYKTRVTAQRALDKVLDLMDETQITMGGSLIVQRTDGRFSIIIINPAQASLMYWVHEAGFGVYGITHSPSTGYNRVSFIEDLKNRAASV